MNQRSVRLNPRWGGPERVRPEQLISWSQHRDPGVKYFSGTATYTKALSVPGELLDQNRRIFLDLGRVQVIAQMTLKGKDLGML